MKKIYHLRFSDASLCSTGMQCRAESPDDAIQQFGRHLSKLYPEHAVAFSDGIEIELLLPSGTFAKATILIRVVT